MKFSICIPNYNYARYISATIKSVLDQDAEIEVIVSDNCSTDDSVVKVEALADRRVAVRRNVWNVGFAGNLDRACRGAVGDRMLLLSSDDLANPGALAVYAVLWRELGPAAERTIFCSGQHVMDSAGAVIESSAIDGRQWADAREDPDLGARIGARVLRVPARDLLARSLAHMRNPFNFATTCYPRTLYEAVEGYGAGALINPDKAFAWKLLSVADEVVYVDQPLFSYRVHEANQNSQQSRSGALKHLVDQYRATFDTEPAVLATAGITPEDLARAFLEHDIGLRGLKALGEGDCFLARRHLAFGRAAYPELAARSRRVWMLKLALLLGPLGAAIAKSRLETALTDYKRGGAIQPGPAGPGNG